MSHEHKHGPDCGHGHNHDHPPKGGSKAVMWGVVAAAVVGVGAFLISKLGEKNAEGIAPTVPDDAWQNRVNASKSDEIAR